MRLHRLPRRRRPGGRRDGRGDGAWGKRPIWTADRRRPTSGEGWTRPVRQWCEPSRGARPVQLLDEQAL